MGFSVANSAGVSTIMAEITLANCQGEAEAEGLLLPQELVDPEMMKGQMQQGILKGQEKPYTFVFQEKSSLPEKLVDYLSSTNQPKNEKSLDPKNGKTDLQYKESQIREKEFKVIDSQKQLPLEGEKKESRPHTFAKTEHTSKHSFETSPPPKTLYPEKHEPPAIKHQQVQAKALEQKVNRELPSKEQSKQLQQESKRNEARHVDLKPQTHDVKLQQADKSEKQAEREIEKQRDKEEGFSRQQHQKNDEEDEELGKKAVVIDESFVKEFDSYAIEESILSQIFDMRVSQFDVLILFMEIMKLEIRGREQERIGRQVEREMQIMHMQNVVETYKKQGKWMLYSSVGAGLLAIVSGAAPIIGHMKGGWILQKLSSVFKSLQDMEKDIFFKQIGKITYSMSEMYKSTGQIQQTFSEGHRSYDQHMSDLYRSDWDESTRTMEEIKDSWKGIENFLHQSLQMYHEAIRQLYS